MDQKEINRLIDEVMSIIEQDDIGIETNRAKLKAYEAVLGAIAKGNIVGGSGHVALAAHLILFLKTQGILHN